jgi:hypothetical protein
MPIIPALRRPRQAHHSFQVSLGYIQQDPVSKIPKNKKSTMC